MNKKRIKRGHLFIISIFYLRQVTSFPLLAQTTGPIITGAYTAPTIEIHSNTQSGSIATGEIIIIPPLPTDTLSPNTGTYITGASIHTLSGSLHTGTTNTIHGGDTLEETPPTPPLALTSGDNSTTGRQDNLIHTTARDNSGQTSSYNTPPSDIALPDQSLHLNLTNGSIPQQTIVSHEDDPGHISITLPAGLAIKDSQNNIRTEAIAPPHFVEEEMKHTLIDTLATIHYGDEQENIFFEKNNEPADIMIEVMIDDIPLAYAGQQVIVHSSPDQMNRQYHTTTTILEERNELLVRFPTSHLTYFNIGTILGDFVINNDATHTTGTSVTLHMDISGATEMKFGNTSGARAAASRESYTTSKSRTLSSGTGAKTVYAAFRNGSGDLVLVEDDIIYTQEVVSTLPITTGLTLHFDASLSSSITETANGISGWDDQSGNNYHARQENATTNQPDYVSEPGLSYDVLSFNGSNDFLAIENLNYNITTPLDGLLTCTVFKTNYNASTSYSANWSLLDFDRSEFFNVYIEGDGDLGFSYAPAVGGIQDNSGNASLNDDERHVACASFDNSATNDTILTANGVIIYSQDRVANGVAISDTTTRYGFIGDGSEAGGYNGGRNNIYYDGRIAEIVYYDQAISNTGRQEIECYLGEKRGVEISGCDADTIPPIATISYTPETSTPGYVLATLTGFSEPVTITNNGGNSNYFFSENGEFTFTFEDAAGNTGSLTATVGRITDTDTLLNQTPTITSNGGSGTATITVASGATGVTIITATDETFNIIGSYGKTVLTGNNRATIEHHEICEPVTVVSHRQRVNAETQRAPRIDAKTSTGFRVKVDNYTNNLGSSNITDIDYIVLASGSYDISGMQVQAGSNTTSSVACNGGGSYNGTVTTFSGTFSTAPAVLHTVASYNDTGWVVSHVNGNDGTRQSEPTTTQMSSVLHRSFNDCTHAAEDIDWIAFEPGHVSTAGGFTLDATVSSDTIACCTTNGYDVNFTSAFSAPPEVALVSQLGEDGGNGGYAMIHDNTAMTAMRLRATIDEDGPAADRSHTTEPVAAISFDQEQGFFFEDNILTYSISGGADSSHFSIGTAGELSFLTGKSPDTPLDANSDNIYEVIVAVCDSHCSMKCATQTIYVNLANICIAAPTYLSFSGAVYVENYTQTIEQQFTGYFQVEDNKGLDSGRYTTLQISHFTGMTYTGIISNEQLERYATGITLLSGDTNTGVVLATGWSSYTPASGIVTFIHRDTGPNDTKIGTYGTKPRLRLTIPPYTKPDTYVAEISYTLYEE